MCEDLDIEVSDPDADATGFRFEALRLAIQEEKLVPEGVVRLADYYYRYAMTGLIVPYPLPEKPKLVK
jgi:hypothetical protein